MNGLTIEHEEQIKYIRDNYHKFRLVCSNVDLLLRCYEELEREREKSEQLLILCEICKDKR